MLFSGFSVLQNCQKANSGRPRRELAPIFGNVSCFHKGWKVRVGFVFTTKKTRKRGLKRWTTKKDTNNKNEGREKRQICKKFEKTFFYKTQVSVSRVFIGVCVRPLLMDEYQFRGIDMPISYRIKKSCIAPYWYSSPINTAIKKSLCLASHLEISVWTKRLQNNHPLHGTVL